MQSRPGNVYRKRVVVAIGGLLLSLAIGGSVRADTIVRLMWDPNQETDLRGYLLYYGSSSGRYGTPVDVGNVTSYDIHGLGSTTTYYFAVAARDLAGNIGAFSNEVSATPTTLIGTPPTVSSANEISTQSSYILQSGRHNIRVGGTNFQTGAGIDLGAGITPGPTSLAGSTLLTATIDVAATAALGGRTLAVTNPDGGKGSLASALFVVRTPDINRDCHVDGADLNLIARVFSLSSTDPGFDAAADLDASGQIDGVDLLIWTEYFALALAVCP
jgi:hypothetical protein